MRTGTKRLLVLEDNDEDFSVILQASEAFILPIRLQRFSRTNQLIEALENQSVVPPHLILLDRRLPCESGHESLKRLRQHASFDRTPIIILSTSNNPQEVRSSYVAGATAYHIKRLETAKMLQLLNQIFTYWLTLAEQVDEAHRNQLTP